MDWAGISRRLFDRRAGPGPLGLSWDGRAIHLAQWTACGARPAALGLASLDCLLDPCSPDPELLREAVDRLRKLARFRRGPLVVALPSRSVRLVSVNYEASAADEEAQVAGLAAERLGEQAASSVVDYVPMRASAEDHGDRSALIAMADQDFVVEWLERLRAGGVEPSAVEIEPLAMRRLICRASEAGAHDNALLVHMNGDRSAVSALWGRRLVLFREILFGEAQLVTEVSRKLELDPDQAAALLERYGAGERYDGDDGTADLNEIPATVAEILRASLRGLAEQVEKAMKYAASRTRGAPVRRIWLVGRAGDWPGFARLLQRLLHVPVVAFDASHATGSSSRERSSGVALALGLGLRGLEP